MPSSQSARVAEIDPSSAGGMIPVAILATAVRAVMTSSPPTHARTSIANLPVKNCQRPTPLVSVARSVPKPYSKPTTDAAKIMTGMTMNGSTLSLRVILNGSVNTPRLSCGET